MAFSRQQMRRFWLAVHLYLGLSVGVVFSLTGLTGSLLVFYVEIDRLINPELVISASKSLAQSYENVIQKLHQTYPERTNAWRLEVPTQPDKPIMARYYKPVETQHQHFSPLVVAINPYTLAIINHRFWGEYAVTWIYDLHYTLLLDETGNTIMAIIGIFCLLSLLSGVYLWWPKNATYNIKNTATKNTAKTNKWRKALAIRLRTGYLRKLYDIHTLLGIYSLILLILLVVTGLILEKPEWFAPSINKISSTFIKPNVQSFRADPNQKITLDSALEIAQKQFPQAQVRWLETPESAFGTYIIRLKNLNEIADRFPKTYVWIDQYSGKILATRNPQHNSNGDVFMDWQHPLHSGEAFGLAGRIIVCFSGIIPTILLVTGYLRWRKKSRKKVVKFGR
ncbi:MAG: PepSY-associated TM helix domain-containing protein [Pseudomonadota bacterium]